MATPPITPAEADAAETLTSELLEAYAKAANTIEPLKVVAFIMGAMFGALAREIERDEAQLAGAKYLAVTLGSCLVAASEAHEADQFVLLIRPSAEVH
jgi:hypothetical protein